MTDKAAISLSVLCAIHCLGLPFLLVLLPSLSALSLDNEAFHLWMVVAILPTSIYALTIGCQQHKKYPLLILGSIGLCLLLLALVLGEEVIGESLEKTLTMLGAMFVAAGHVWNFRLCRKSDECECTDA